MKCCRVYGHILRFFLAVVFASLWQQASCEDQKVCIPSALCTQSTLFLQKLVQSAMRQIGVTTSYVPTYKRIDYPMGDVPLCEGVCTDVVIRAYRDQGIDLQELVHQDMKQSFEHYPNLWGLKRPDTNIDHRRVPNLIVFFTRKGSGLPVSQNIKDYKPGDLVTWDIIVSARMRLPHIGIVSDAKDPVSGNPLIIHNIGSGAERIDCLFHKDLVQTGHFRYIGSSRNP